jgi:probable HAF family extracellular repeat protein
MCAAICLTVLGMAAQARAQFTFQDLTLGFSDNTISSRGEAVNNAGQVTGFRYSTPMIWSGASFLNLQIPNDRGTGFPFGSGVGSGINNRGQVTGLGRFTADISETYHAFFYNGSTHNLGTLGGTNSVGRAINDAGQVAGFSDVDGDAAQHAFIWNGSSMQDIGTLGGGDSYAYGINQQGMAAGGSYINATDVHAFLWTGSIMQDLATLGGTRAAASGINDFGQMSGASYLAGDGAYRATRWTSSGIQDLGTLGGLNSFGNGIGNGGQIVGTSDVIDGAIDPSTNLPYRHGFYWDGASMQDLNVYAPDGWTITTANDISDNSYITGTMVSTADPTLNRAYLLTPAFSPVPEPGPIALCVGAGTVGLMALRRKKRA